MIATIVLKSAFSEFSIILFALLMSMFLSIGLSAYSFKIQNNKAANTFGLAMLIIVFWVLIKIISLFVILVETRELLHKINIIIIALFIPLLLLVAIFYSNIPKWYKLNHIYFLLIVPVFLIILISISSYHNYLFSEFKITIENGIPIHTFKYKILYQLNQLYNYLLLLFTFIILIKSLFTKDKVFRKQIILFIIGLLIPLFYDIAFHLGYSPINNYNLSPVFISIGNCFIAWSMIGYKFLKIIPVAHYQIINNMPDIMIITNTENQIIDINKSCEQFFGIKKDKIVGISFYHFFKDYPELTENYTQSDPIKEISIQKNDKTYYFSNNISAISNNNIVHAKILMMHDISERIKAGIQINRLSIAIEQAPVTVVITDLEGKIEYVNPAFTKITGYTYDEAIGNNPRVLKGTTPPETFDNLWETVLEGNVWNGEFINKKKSGEFYYEEATIAPIKNNKNEIISFIAIKNDITKRKKAEEKLKQSEENLKSAQSIGNVGHWEYNNSTNELFWSEQIYRIYEISPLEFKPAYDDVVAMFHPDDRKRVVDEFALSIQNKTQFEIQHRIVTPKGKIKYITERSTTTYDEKGNAIITLGSVSDITQLKRVEEELNNEKVLLKSLIDSIPDLIFVKDVNGIFKLVNEAITKAYKIAQADVIGKSDFDLYETSLAEFFREKDKIVMNSGKSETNEEPVTYANGIKGWLETTKTPFIGIDGKIQGIIGVSRDITLRRKNEDALRENQANLLALVENTDDNIWAIDSSFHIVFANLKFKNAFMASFGSELKQGMNILEALPLSVRKIWEPRYKRALNNERFIFEEHFSIGNLQFYFEIAMNPIIAESSVIGVSVFSRDIAERKTAEKILLTKNEEIATQNEELQQLNEELQTTNHALQVAKALAEESEELFKQLMTYSPIYVYIKDINLRSVRMSHNYKMLFGKPVHELLGKTNEEIMPLEFAKKITADELQVISEAKSKETEDNINGKIYTSILFPIFIEGKLRYIAGYTIDSTDRRNAEIKIQKQNEELIELNATKDKFFSIIAHDLRNPFSAILGFSDYLVNNIETSSADELKLFASNINISATTTYKLLENLLDWSRLKRGLVKADLQIQNLKNITDEMVDLHIGSAAGKSIEIFNKIENDVLVFCDSEMTKTVLRNLISNAIKFTGDNGTVTIQSIQNNNFIEIQVIDTGVGIPEDKIPFLFSIEKNTSTKGTANETGTGLGLLLCKELIENQGGMIGVKSQEEKGCTFYFTLKSLNE